MTTPSIGPLEELVLMSVQRLQPTYAADVCAMINEAGYHFSDQNGSMYNILERLETKGCVVSAMEPSRPMRGGRARRSYTLTADGAQALLATEACRQKIREVSR